MRFANRWPNHWHEWWSVRALPLAFAAVLFANVGSAAEAEKKKVEPSVAENQQKLEAAQKRLEEAAREVAALGAALSDEMVPPHVRSIHIRERAMLGINIGDRQDRDEGVEVLSVSPGGAAEAAGIKAGDVLLQAGGKQLKSEGGTSPREKLLGVLREAKPGDKVAVSYRRDGKVATATITTEAVKDRFFAMQPFAPGQMAKLEKLSNLAYWRSDGVFGSAELVSLTPKLGEYFGSEKGLLVVRAPADSRLQLQEGDVILDIDGRMPLSPSHALRILGSYQSGEKLKLNVLRMKKRMSVDITIPESAWDRTREGAHVFPHGEAYDFDVVVPAPPPVPAVAPMTPGVRVPKPRPAPIAGERDGPV